MVLVLLIPVHQVPDEISPVLHFQILDLETPILDFFHKVTEVVQASFQKIDVPRAFHLGQLRR
jgi:hypothetical protein